MVISPLPAVLGWQYMDVISVFEMLGYVDISYVFTKSSSSCRDVAQSLSDVHRNVLVVVGVDVSAIIKPDSVTSEG